MAGYLCISLLVILPRDALRSCGSTGCTSKESAPSSLVAMAFTLEAMASTLEVKASNLLAMAFATLLSGKPSPCKATTNGQSHSFHRPVDCVLAALPRSHSMQKIQHSLCAPFSWTKTALQPSNWMSFSFGLCPRARLQVAIENAI